MASNKSPGIAPLGHPPMSKVKEEGPKKYHDNHGKDASVPAKGDGKIIRGEAWEMQYKPCVYKDKENTRGAEFSPRKSDERMTTYNKVNRTDH